MKVLIFLLCTFTFCHAADEAISVDEMTEKIEEIFAAPNSTTVSKKETWLGILNFTLHIENTIARLSKPDENILFAPVNILAVLGALLLGAEGNSKTEILDVLGAASCQNITVYREDVLHSVLGGMLNNFVEENKNNPGINITLAKAIFVQNGTEIQEDFRNLSQCIYRNEIETVDFVFNPNATNIINEWVSDRTKGRIPQLLSSPLSTDTKAVLASALYFNGEWEEPFSDNTTWQDFNTGNETVQVKMMLNRGTVRVLHDKERKFQVLGLPYKGKNVTMYIVLPDEGQDLRTVIDERITFDDLHQIPKKSAIEQEVTYLVPYMDLEASVDLKTILKQLGLHSIFEPNNANLSRIADDLYVSEAIHKVNLQVTEAGTTGVASTSIVIETRFPHVDTVVINRPFLFYIYHVPTGSITFWGTVIKPIPYKPK